jgi:ubiquinone/menaquinone biosynthesis C-methylase UbiE
MTEFEEQAGRVLREIGLSDGQSVIDFGCGSGTWALPAARIVGDGGTVYALDKAWHGMWPGEGLAALARRAEAEALSNVRVMKTSGELTIDLDAETVDVALAHDVLHSYYFSPQQISAALEELHRVLKPGGILSFYPGDPETSGDLAQLRRILESVQETGFHLESEYSGRVIHEERIVHGCVRVFRKTHRGNGTSA